MKCNMIFNWKSVYLMVISRRAISALLIAAFYLFLPNQAFAKSVKVYLSPANHDGKNKGCYSVNEDKHSRRFAVEAAAQLRKKGHSVRIGSKAYKANTLESNNWNAKVHVPIHSNGGPGLRNCFGPMPAKWGGTEVYYASMKFSETYYLAKRIHTTVSPASPGTSDKLEKRTNLWELNATNASAVYLEVERHTWNRGAKWLRDYAHLSAYRLANAIDAFYNPKYLI